jgi:hypothetical protein
MKFIWVYLKLIKAEEQRVMIHHFLCSNLCFHSSNNSFICVILIFWLLHSWLFCRTLALPTALFLAHNDLFFGSTLCSCLLNVLIAHHLRLFYYLRLNMLHSLLKRIIRIKIVNRLLLSSYIRCRVSSFSLLSLI